MRLVITYVVLVAIGGAFCYAIGWAVDAYDKSLGLLVFLGALGVTLYVAWKIAVYITDPKRTRLRA
jgi:hypothetical protein